MGGQQETVLHFYLSNFMHGTRFAGPMLLQFICLLVNNNEDMDLTKRNVPRGEIYWRLLRCIYRKLCENKKTVIL